MNLNNTYDKKKKKKIGNGLTICFWAQTLWNDRTLALV